MQRLGAARKTSTDGREPASNGFVFVVDDNEDDRCILLHALKGASVSRKVHCALNGDEAISFLRDLLESSSPNLPALTLLDIKMPRTDGHEVLAWIRAQPELSSVPVFILTSSELETDRIRAQELGASDYWVKPFLYTEYQTLAGKIRSFLDET